MGILENVNRGTRNRPRRILLYAVKGIGKSTWAANAPNPIFIKTEDGLDDIPCDSVPQQGLVKSYPEFIDILGGLYTDEHNYQTLVIDTADWLERLVWADVCRLRNLKSIDDLNFQDGYKFALDQWGQILAGLDSLRNDRNMTIILLAHEMVVKCTKPGVDSYDLYMPRLHKLAAQLVMDWCSEVLFANYKIYTRQTDEGFSKIRSIGTGGNERVLYTTEKAAHKAANRLNLPDEMPLVWSEFAKYLPGASATAA